MSAARLLSCSCVGGEQDSESLPIKGRWGYTVEKKGGEGHEDLARLFTDRPICGGFPVPLSLRLA